MADPTFRGRGGSRRPDILAAFVEHQLHQLVVHPSVPAEGAVSLFARQGLMVLRVVDALCDLVPFRSKALFTDAIAACARVDPTTAGGIKLAVRPKETGRGGLTGGVWQRSRSGSSSPHRRPRDGRAFRQKVLRETRAAWRSAAAEHQLQVVDPDTLAGEVGDSIAVHARTFTTPATGAR